LKSPKEKSPYRGVKRAVTNCWWDHSSLAAPLAGSLLAPLRCAAPCRRRPLPREVVADERVAARGIIPQAPVELKRLIELVDLSTGVADGRRNVNTRRLLRQRQ